MIFNQIFKNSKKIAIVFSSNTVLKNNMGKLIDSYDEVIRFNRSPTLGFEKYVGRRTSLRVINNSVFQNIIPHKSQNWSIDKDFINNVKKTKILVISPIEFDVLTRNKYEINSNIYFYLTQNRSLKLYLLSLSKKKDPLLFFHLFIYFYLLRKNLSVGCLVTIYLLILNFEVNIFGYNSNEKNTRTHYWEKAGKIGKHHNLNFEKIIINNLIKKNLIKFKC